MKLKLVLIMLVIVCTQHIAVQGAQAHVLFVDSKTNIAAIFHSNPDDDPIAGEVSELYFDIQDKNSDVRIPYNGYDLIITDEQGQETTVPMTASGSTALAKYTFPAQGLYLMKLQSQPKYDAFQKVTINGSLRVNRGVGASTVVENNSSPTLGVIGGLTAVALLGIVAFNNRSEIIRKSRF